MVDQDDVEIEPDPFGEDQLPPMELPHTLSSKRDGVFKKKRYYNQPVSPITSQPPSVRWHIGGIFGSSKHDKLKGMHEVDTIETIANDIPYMDDSDAEHVYLTEDGVQPSSSRKLYE